MSDTILNRLHNAPKDNSFSKEQLEKNENELRSELDKRIADILHIIEFENPTYPEAFKLCRKLQNFLRKRRLLKGNGYIYIPRTESGKLIINGTIQKQLTKKEKRKRHKSMMWRLKNESRRKN